MRSHIFSVGVACWLAVVCKSTLIFLNWQKKPVSCFLKPDRVSTLAFAQFEESTFCDQETGILFHQSVFVR